MRDNITLSEHAEIHNLLKESYIFDISANTARTWIPTHVTTFSLLPYDWKWNWFRLYTRTYEIHLYSQPHGGSIYFYKWTNKSPMGRHLKYWYLNPITFEELLDECPEEYKDLFIFNINLFT